MSSSGRNSFDERPVPNEALGDATFDVGVIRGGLRRGEFFPLYQPQVCLRSGHIVGLEALARWNHESGIQAPSRFLVVAEDAGLMPAIDMSIRTVAFTQAAAWQRRGHRVSIAVNLSLADVTGPERRSAIGDLITDSGAAIELVDLEVTERIMMNGRDLRRVLEPLRRAGVRVVMDDYGVGASVAARLHHCPVDTLKIDKRITTAVTTHSSSRSRVKALLALGTTHEFTVLAEGIESADQLDVVTRLGCDLGQGYLLGRPIDAVTIGQRLDWQRSAIDAGERTPA